jgi:predicted small lipoprotein YifL
MRLLPLGGLAALALCAGCGQKGPLVLPTKPAATPVEIRTPATPAKPDARPDDGTEAPAPRH